MTKSHFSWTFVGRYQDFNRGRIARKTTLDSFHTQQRTCNLHDPLGINAISSKSRLSWPWKEGRCGGITKSRTKTVYLTLRSRPCVSFFWLSWTTRGRKWHKTFQRGSDLLLYWHIQLVYPFIHLLPDYEDLSRCYLFFLYLEEYFPSSSPLAFHINGIRNTFFSLLIYIFLVYIF